MVIGWSERDEDGAFDVRDPGSTWKRVLKTQMEPRIPCLLIPQPAHAVLAGDLAEALLPEAFGDLPKPIKQGILMHDTGWAMLDAAQIQRLRSQDGAHAAPAPFVANSPHEMVEAWTASINSVERFSPAAGFVVSRHFSLLATPAVAEHRGFIGAEQTRRQRLEAKCNAPAAVLARWTAALGFCDLLSLYLLTGLKNGACFPLVHPASDQAQSAKRVVLDLDAHGLCFTPPIFQGGQRVEIEVLKHPVPAEGPRTESLSWEIVA